MNPLRAVWVRRCAVANRLETYDNAGGLANDHDARHKAARELAADLGIPDETAFELLADALAQRASRNLAQSE